MVINKTIANIKKLMELEIKEIEPEMFAFASLSGDRIEIGEKRHSPSQPYLELNKWGGEVSLKVDIPYGRDAIKTLNQNELEYVNHKYDIKFYPKEPEEIIEIIQGEKHVFKINEEGGVEFDIVLKEKLKSNILEFTIETKGLKFYYQPPLHLEHPTWADEDGDGKADTFRPENVVGSYAVYHELKQGDCSQVNGKNYKAGKAFHIYRPKIKDAEGKEIWGDLNIDVKKGTLTVTIDQDWLDNAAYPVKIDPNFGYEMHGVSNSGYNSDIICGSRFTIGESGIANSIIFWKEYAGIAKCGIYKYSDNSFIGETEEGEGTLISGQWRKFDFSDPKPFLTASTGYWLVGFYKDLINTMFDSGDPNQGGSQNRTYINGFPPTWSPTLRDVKYSIYCTYVAVDCPTPIPSFTHSGESCI